MLQIAIGAVMPLAYALDGDERARLALRTRLRDMVDASMMCIERRTRFG